MPLDWDSIAIVVAEICHEANRAYCKSLGDNSQPTWDDAPTWQRDSAIRGIKNHVVALENGHTQPGPEESHESWMRLKKEEGWKFGPVKDVEKKEHPCMRPWEQLPFEQRNKDILFTSIASAMITRACW